MKQKKHLEKYLARRARNIAGKFAGTSATVTRASRNEYVCVIRANNAQDIDRAVNAVTLNPGLEKLMRGFKRTAPKWGFDGVKISVSVRWVWQQD